jgi:hypothetical protein
MDEALTSSLARVLEALREPRSGEAPPAAERPSASGGPRELPGIARRAVTAPARAAAETLTGIATELVPRVLDRIDLDAVLARIDVDALVARVDIDRLLDSVDPNRLLDRVDVDDLVRRVDAAALAREALEGIDIGEVIRESTSSLGSDTVDAVRVQGMVADEAVARVVDRVLRRRRARDTALRGGDGRR